ncbi:unnamed protein product [Arctogadus glacialis]
MNSFNLFYLVSSSDVSTATVILWVVTMLLCVLSSAVCRSYFVSRISSPRRSTIGLWLMDQHQQALVRNILNIEDFVETDLLGDKHPIKITGGALEASECTDAPPASLGELPLSQEYVAAAQVIAMSSLYKISAFFPKPGLHRQQPRRQGSTF